MGVIRMCCCVNSMIPVHCQVCRPSLYEWNFSLGNGAPHQAPCRAMLLTAIVISDSIPFLLLPGFIFASM